MTDLKKIFYGFLFPFLFITGLLVSPLTHAAKTNILPPPEKVSKHVYAWIGPLEGPSKTNHGYRMNLCAVVGNKAVAVIDSGYTENMAKQMLSQTMRAPASSTTMIRPSATLSE